VNPGTKVKLTRVAHEGYRQSTGVVIELFEAKGLVRVKLDALVEDGHPTYDAWIKNVDALHGKAKS
jgi:uncharacterized protein YegJ (DUF2314 family)